MYVNLVSVLAFYYRNAEYKHVIEECTYKEQCLFSLYKNKIMRILSDLIYD